MSESNKKVALLIDADNFSPKYIKTIIDEITTNYGIISLKRAYADWTKANLNSTKELLPEFAITPIQQFAYSSGKNSTDFAMVIDAMDILYTKDIDTFCLATSDVDYTRIALRLREEGKTVIGFGETDKARKDNKNSVNEFVKACNEYKYADNLFNSSDEEPDTSLVPSEIKSFIINTISSSDGGVLLGMLKPKLLAAYSDFDERTYGYTKFLTFIDSFDELSVITKGSVNTVVLNIDRKKIDKYVIKLLQGAKGGLTTADIHNELAKQFKGFRIKSIGYSTMKSFLKSIKGVDINKNGKYYYKG